MDVSGATPVFSIRDILSPYGILRDSIAIPGSVVSAMATSITELQSNFPSNILVGPPASIIFDVDEGRGFSADQAVTLTNTGAFGSLLGATLSTSAAFVTVSPGVLGNLSANESGMFSVAVNSRDLLVGASPYHEVVLIQSSGATNSPQTLDVIINVRPKAQIVLDRAVLGFSAVAPVGGPFAPVPTQQFVVTNSGPAGSVLNFQIQRVTGLSDSWLASFAPVVGELSSGMSQTITVAVLPHAGLSRGTYRETLRVSGYSSNSYADILLQLVVT